MSLCYKCGVELVLKEEAGEELLKTKRYKSEEHILPNFCGGQLTSMDLLCSKCNSDLGTELDGELDKQLLFHHLFSLKLDRGKQKDRYIVAYTFESKKKVLVNKNLGWKHFKPEWKISEDGELIELKCQTLEEAKKILTGLARKNPKINIEENLKKLKVVDEFLPERVDFSHVTIGSKEAFRAISKIAINYFLFTGGNKELIKDVIEYVCTNDKPNNYVAFHYSFIAIHKLGKNEISHVIFLKGDNRKKLLYCYIELFSVTNFIVILNREYEGENFSKQYCYDVLKAQEFNKEIKINLLYDIIEPLKYKEYYDKHFEETQEYLKDKVTRAFAVLDDITPKPDNIEPSTE